MPGYIWMAARWGSYGRQFLAPPTLVVIHSGDVASNVAAYLASCKDGRQVSAHFSWLPGQQCYVQQVLLHKQAWHAGRGFNDRSIGIEMSGPWHQNPRDPVELDRLRRLLTDLREAMPSLVHWARHSDLNPNKSDPGPGFPDTLPEEVGLVRV